MHTLTYTHTHTCDTFKLPCVILARTHTNVILATLPNVILARTYTIVIYVSFVQASTGSTTMLR